MSRLLSTVLVLTLLGGTAAAFAITESLKLQKTPIIRPAVTKLFSPNSERGVTACPPPRRVRPEPGSTACVAFRLRKPDRLTVEIVDSDGDTVATLADSVRRDNERVGFTWDGRDDNGLLVDEGRYRPKVHLDEQHRTIVMPNPIEVDLTAPDVALLAARPRVFSPDRDGRAEFVRVRFRANEAARALLLVNGRQLGKGRIEKKTGKLNWFGKVDGRSLPPGTYAIAVRAEDRAGNVSPATRAIRVSVRYVELPDRVVRVAAGARFRVPVDTDAKRITWRLAGRSGTVTRRPLRVQAPAQPGRYTLFVAANGHADRATVMVRPAP